MPCTISWMASSAATAKRRSRPFLTALFFFFLAVSADAVDLSCEARGRGLDDFQKLLEVPAAALLKVSSDRRLEAILRIEQEYLRHCRDPKWEPLVEAAKRAHLEKLGVNLRRLPATDLDPLFRGLITLEKRAKPLKERIAKGRSAHSALKYLRSIFGDANEILGVVVLGATAEDRDALEKFLGEVCPEHGACPFWSSTALYKVVVAKDVSVAAYLGETAELVLSRALLKGRNLLHKVVLLHELTHVAERHAWLTQRLDWSEAFKLFSGWATTGSGAWTAKVRKGSNARKDTLTTLSVKSPFSILPDVVYHGIDGFDGFVLGKAYEETIAQKNVSEDIADHVAVYRFAPERYCLEGQPLAPKKWKWVGMTLFGGDKPLACTPTTPSSKSP